MSTFGRALNAAAVFVAAMLAVIAAVAATNPGGDEDVRKRLAIVIGNSSYESDRYEDLKNPVNDARRLAESLQRLNFEVVTGLDVTYAQFQALLKKHEPKLSNYSAVVVFYAGHGIAINDENYLLPVDAIEPTSVEALKERALSLNDMIVRLTSPDRQTAIFLDACRNEVAGKGVAGLGKGLAKVEGRNNVNLFVALATQPGMVTYDGTGANSPFTTALLEYLEVPALSISDIMVKVRARTKALTVGQQTPADFSNLESQFYFTEQQVIDQRELRSMLQRIIEEPELKEKLRIQLASADSDLQSTVLILGRQLVETRAVDVETTPVASPAPQAAEPTPESALSTSPDEAPAEQLASLGSDQEVDPLVLQPPPSAAPVRDEPAGAALEVSEETGGSPAPAVAASQVDAVAGAEPTEGAADLAGAPPASSEELPTLVLGNRSEPVSKKAEPALDPSPDSVRADMPVPTPSPRPARSDVVSVETADPDTGSEADRIAEADVVAVEKETLQPADSRTTAPPAVASSEGTTPAKEPDVPAVVAQPLSAASPFAPPASASADIEPQMVAPVRLPPVKSVVSPGTVISETDGPDVDMVAGGPATTTGEAAPRDGSNVPAPPTVVNEPAMAKAPAAPAAETPEARAEAVVPLPEVSPFAAPASVPGEVQTQVAVALPYGSEDEGLGLEEMMKSILPTEPQAGRKDDTQLARRIQKELQRLGCYRNAVDGVWGKGSRKALSDYLQRTRQGGAGTEPSYAVLSDLFLRSGRVCRAPVPVVKVATTSTKVIERTKVTRRSTPPKGNVTYMGPVKDRGKKTIKTVGGAGIF